MKRLLLAIPLLGIAALSWAQATTVLSGVQGPTGDPGTDAVLAQKATTLVGSALCAAGDIVTDIDDTTGALVCTTVPAVNDVLAGNGINVNAVGSNRAVSVSGAYNGPLVVSALTVREQGGNPVRIVFGDTDPDPSYWAIEAKHQGAGPAASAELSLHCRQSQSSAEFTPFTVSGASELTTSGRWFGTVGASGYIVTNNTSTSAVEVARATLTETAMVAQGRVDYLGPDAITGASVSGKTFAINAAPSGPGPVPLFQEANPVRLPVYRVSAVGTTASCIGAEDIALGGGCKNTGPAGAFVRGQRLLTSSYTCTFTASGETYVTCLKGF
jgi:hypothetical protein